MSLKKWVIGAIAIVGIVLYGVGVWAAGQYSLVQDAAGMPPFLLDVITVVGAALAANFGAFAGIDAPTLRSQSVISFETWIRGIGALIYLVSLLLALWFWWQTGWEVEPTRIVRTVPEHSRMLVGILAAGVALIFTSKWR